MKPEDYRASPPTLQRELIQVAQSAVIAAVVLGAAMYGFFSNQLVALWATGFGAAVGALWRYAMLKDGYRRLKADPPQFAGEAIIHEGFAKYDGIAAYLCLTEKRLYLVMHPFENNTISHFWRDIKRIYAYNRCGFWPSGICVVTRDEVTHCYVIYSGRDRWVEEIYRAWRRNYVTEAALTAVSMVTPTAPSNVVATDTAALPVSVLETIIKEQPSITNDPAPNTKDQPANPPLRNSIRQFTSGIIPATPLAAAVHTGSSRSSIRRLVAKLLAPAPAVLPPPVAPTDALVPPFVAAANIRDDGQMRVQVTTDFGPGVAEMEIILYKFTPAPPVYRP